MEKRAGVVKLVDALDSKSSGPCVRVGSIPTSGTTPFQGIGSRNLTPSYGFSRLINLSMKLPGTARTLVSRG